MGSLTVPVKGMHCKSCTIMIADELEKITGVKRASVSLKDDIATVYFDKRPTSDQIRDAIEAAGYEMVEEEKSFFSSDITTWRQLLMNFSIILGILYFFGRLGFGSINFNSLSGNSGVMALVVGLTAGFSTCMALVGGLVFGLSARFAEKHTRATTLQKFTPHLLFNLGRIATFFVLGGVIGVFGGIFNLNGPILGLLTIAIGFVMIILGLQLTDIFPRLSGKSITLPAGVAKFLGIKKHQNKEYSSKSAFILGGLSFFLPCGFTQAMQLVAIASGNFVTGAIIMGMFAIGTAPGLLGVGGLTSVIKGKSSRVFFRFAGVLVVLLAIYNIYNGLNLTGFKPSFNFGSSVPKTVRGPVTTLKTTFTVDGDIPTKDFYVKAGQPYAIEIDAREDGQGCMSTIMIPGVYDTPLLIRRGINRVEFVAPDRKGDYQITCAMGVVRGTLHVQ